MKWLIFVNEREIWGHGDLGIKGYRDIGILGYWEEGGRDGGKERYRDIEI